MHTFSKAGYRIHHNGDYSGNATVHNERTGKEVDVPCWFLLEFAAEVVRAERISNAMKATHVQLLGMDKLPL